MQLRIHALISAWVSLVFVIIRKTTWRVCLGQHQKHQCAPFLGLLYGNSSLTNRFPSQIPLTKGQWCWNTYIVWRHHEIRQIYVNIPRIPSHTTVYSLALVAIFRWNKTLISFTGSEYFLRLIWDGEHSDITVCWLLPRLKLKIPKASLHTFKSDNMTCSTRTAALNQFFFWTGFIVHIQSPVARKSAGKSGKVK